MRMLVLVCLLLAVSYYAVVVIAISNDLRRLRNSREDQFANWRRRPRGWEE